MHAMTLAFFENLLRGPDLLILLILGLLIFGKRLPEVGRGLGRGIVEFRKGLKGVEDDIEDNANKAAKPPTQLPNRDSVGAPPGEEGKYDRRPPQLNPAPPPTTSTGEDARVSRADSVEARTNQPQ